MKEQCMLGRFLFLLFFAISLFPLQSAETYTVKGRIIGKLSRKPIPYAGVSLFGYPGKATSSDSLGLFAIRLVPPGVYRDKSLVTVNILLSIQNLTTSWNEWNHRNNENIKIF